MPVARCSHGETIPGIVGASKKIDGAIGIHTVRSPSNRWSIGDVRLETLAPVAIALGSLAPTTP